MYSCTPAEAMCTIAWHTTTHDYSASALSVANLALLLFRSVHVNVGFENPHTGLSQIRSGSVCLFMVGCSWQGLERDYERIAMGLLRNWVGPGQPARPAQPDTTTPPRTTQHLFHRVQKFGSSLSFTQTRRILE